MESLIFVPFAVVLGLGVLGFWLWMLIDCIRNEPKEGNDRIVWVLVIVFTKILGALLYYFVRRPERPGLDAGSV